MRPGLWLCGCDPARKNRNYFTTMDRNGHMVTSRYDGGGNSLCPEHGEPLYGFRSPMTHTVIGRRIDYGNLARDKTPLKLIQGGKTEDVRDNRDPEEVYAELQRERKPPTNGHVDQ